MTRLASGHLGVQLSARPFAAGGVIDNGPPRWATDYGAPPSSEHPGSRPTQVNIINNGAPVEPKVEEVQDGRGNRKMNIVLDEMVAASLGKSRVRRRAGLLAQLRLG